MVYWYITKKYNILNSSKNIRLLHVTPEKNLQKMLKSFSHIKYISGDLNPLINCDIRFDVADMYFEDNFFDAIICSHVLVHIVDNRKATRELFRVLKPEGFAILQVTIFKNTKKLLKIFQLLFQKKEKDILGKRPC